jgi:hypothetical protein
MSSRRLTHLRTAVLAGLCAAALSSCAGGAQTTGRSPAYLVIDQLLAASGTSTTFGNTLESDVQTKGSVYEDQGQVQMHLDLKDIGTATSPTTPTSNNQVTITSYHVAYARTDGQNAQGVDVPYAFDGAATATVPASGDVTFTFVLVRAQAKLEAPLVGLVGSGGQKIISTIATVTFYGQDQAGNQVSVSGTISVNFADWADPS